jgi:hypothetical protein
LSRCFEHQRGKANLTGLTVNERLFRVWEHESVAPGGEAAMMCPPSFPKDMEARAFRAGNGELGIPPDDTSFFLAACRSDGVMVLGWELWLVDHEWDFTADSPVPAMGSWCGGIPVQGSDVLAVIGGDGDVDETERQLTSLNWKAEVEPVWLPHIRVNFTLDD